MRPALFVLVVLLTSSCCDTFEVRDFRVCVETEEKYENQIICQDDAVLEKDMPITISVKIESSRRSTHVYYKISDVTDNNARIAFYSGEVEELKEVSYCHSVATHTFDVPESGAWPDTILINLYVDCLYQEYEMMKQFVLL